MWLACAARRESRGYTMNRTLKVVGAAVLAASAVGLGAATDVRAQGPRHLVDSAPEGDVSVWAMGAEGEKLGMLADAFMEEFPDVSVEVTAVPWDSAHDKIVTAIAGGEVPDVSQIGTTWMGEFATLGGLEPTPDTIDPAQFFEGAWNTTVVDGIELRRALVRRDAARLLPHRPRRGGRLQPGAGDVGRADPARPGDGQTAAPSGASACNPAAPGAWQTFMPFFWQAGGEIVDEDEQLHARLRGLRRRADVLRLVLRERARPADGLRPARRGPVRRRRRRRFISGPWMIGIVTDAGADPETWTVAHQPTETSRARRSSAAATSPCSSSPTTRTAAWAFVEFLSRPEVQVMWYETVQRPARRCRRRGTTRRSPRTPCCRHSASSSTTPRRRRRSPTWEQIAAGIDSQIEQVTVGDASPEDACAAMQEEADSIGTGL